MKLKLLLISSLLLCMTWQLQAQDLATFKLYNPNENATAELAKAVAKAKASKKHVLVQIGGNWCIWCARFHEFIKDPQIDSMLQANYVPYYLNYSKENRNPALLAKLDYPQRFGFPVFIILDGNGRRIHTQDSGLLEEAKSYDKKKVMTFLENWAPIALDPSAYKKF